MVFFEKKYRIRKENYETFWLGGISSKWSSPDGGEIESCCVLTTESNELIKPLIIACLLLCPMDMRNNGQSKLKILELKGLLPIMMGWSTYGWVVEEVNKKPSDQMSLF